MTSLFVLSTPAAMKNCTMTFVRKRAIVMEISIAVLQTIHFGKLR